MSGTVLGAVLLSGAAWGDPGFHISLNKSRFIHLPAATDRITVGNPRVADVKLLDPRHLYVVGQTLGTTNVVLCSKTDCFRTIQVEVTHDLDALKAKLHELFPKERPKISSSQGAVVLSGQVSNVEKMNAMLQIARTFASNGDQTSQQPVSPSSGAYGAGPPAANSENSVINLMQVGGPQQVMLGVTVAELNRSLARNFKVDFSAIGASGQFTGGSVSGNAVVSALTQLVSVGASSINPYGVFFRFLGSDVAVKTVINAAKTNGLAKILAEPNLTTISGQDASFLSGGEFPVPVPQTIGGAGAGYITIQWKQFGVNLNFLPVVLDSGRISLKLGISVSEISSDNAVVASLGSNVQESFVIPSLTKRSADSTLELDDGQTLGIAGLINDSLREQIQKFPGLGDIPILGQLFTSQTFLKNETELVIFVTPHLVKPMPPNRIKLPTDDFVEPSDADFYWMGRTEAVAGPGPRRTDQYANGGLRGHFGQQP